MIRSLLILLALFAWEVKADSGHRQTAEDQVQGYIDFENALEKVNLSLKDFYGAKSNAKSSLQELNEAEWNKNIALERHGKDSPEHQKAQKLYEQAETNYVRKIQRLMHIQDWIIAVGASLEGTNPNAFKAYERFRTGAEFMWLL